MIEYSNIFDILIIIYYIVSYTTSATMRKLNKKHEQENRLVVVPVYKSKVHKQSNGFITTLEEMTIEQLSFIDGYLNPVNPIVIDRTSPILNGDIVCDLESATDRGIFIVGLSIHNLDSLSGIYKIVASYKPLEDYHGNKIPIISNEELEYIFNLSDNKNSIKVINPLTNEVEKLIINQNL